MKKYDRQWVEEVLRDKVLAALDDGVKHLFDREKEGWKDQDLPELFKALDQQIAVITERLKVELT